MSDTNDPITLSQGQLFFQETRGYLNPYEWRNCGGPFGKGCVWVYAGIDPRAKKNTALTWPPPKFAYVGEPGAVELTTRNYMHLVKYGRAEIVCPVCDAVNTHSGGVGISSGHRACCQLACPGYIITANRPTT